MPYRELSMIEIKEVLRLRARGHGLKAIARRVGLGRNTVRRYIAEAEKSGVALDKLEGLDEEALSELLGRIQPGTAAIGSGRAACRQRREQIAKWAKECDAPKIRRLLKRDGVDVSLRTLQRFMKEELAPKRSTVRLRDPDPGVLEFDFLELGTFVDEDEHEQKVFAALMTASVSRHQFLWPCLSQTRDDVVEALEAAWAFFDGVFPVVLPDNLTPVVKKADPVSPKFNLWFFEYAQARGFEIDPARARKPRDKAKVERQVRYVRRDFFGGENFRTLAAMRTAGERWSRDVAGLREHKTTRRQPLVHFAETDARVLLPAPDTPYDTPIWSEHTVGADHAITVEKALYSVPYQVVGKVRVQTTLKTVKIYCKRQLVKTHVRVPTGKKQLDPADAPPGLGAAVERTAESLFIRADAASAPIGEYARKLAPNPRLRISEIRKVWRLLHACETYGAEAVTEACLRALEFDVIDVKRIEGMLSKGLETRRAVAIPSSRSPRGETLTFERPSSAFRTMKESS